MNGMWRDVTSTNEMTAYKSCLVVCHVKHILLFVCIFYQNYEHFNVILKKQTLCDKRLYVIG